MKQKSETRKPGETAAAPPPSTLMTSRFTDETLLQNRAYCQRTKAKCIYCSPSRISQNIKENSALFILELNITRNRVEGIGLAKNCARYGVCVYSNGNYNRYSYLGHYRIARDDMTPEEEQIMGFFDIVCFRGIYHMKRGSGITRFPPDILRICNTRFDLVEFVRQMFKRRLS